MKKLLFISFWFISDLCFSQIKSVVIDRETKAKLPYVNIWVENENIETTSNQKGEFKITINKPVVIVFSAIGFVTRKILSDSIKNFVELNTSITELNQVIVSANKEELSLTIGSFNKSKVNHYFGCGTKPWIVARYFPYQENYTKTRLLERIKILTQSDVKDAKFNIRLYSVNKDGEPDKYQYDKNIIGVARKGKKVTEIDLSGFNIEFPEDGFFVAIEWLIVDENIHEYNYTIEGSKKKLEGFSYEPSIGTVLSETDKNSWTYTEGKWSKVRENSSETSNRYRNKYHLLAIELSLTN